MTPPAVPDLIQAVVGYRTWAVDAEGWLLPFSLGAVAGPWRPGINHATCHYVKWRGGGASRGPVGLAVRDVHDAPHPRCMCGLYALTNAADPRLPRNEPELALGAIGAWGDLEVHRDGFRAQYATVVALAVSPRASAHLRRRHERAAARYGVELVAPELLEVTGLKHAAPVPAELLPGGPGLERPPRPGPAPRGRARRRPARAAGQVAVTPAGRGFRVDDHTWLDAGTLRCGITRAFAAHLGPGPVDLALPGPGAFHRTSDALAHVTGAAGETLRVWTPLTAGVGTVNPALADDPGLLLRDPEGAGWIATLVPIAWAAEAGGLEWGPRGAVAYRSALTRPDPWADLRSTALHVRSAQEVLAELRRRRAAPRFADAEAVRARLVAPLAAALTAEPDAAAAVARLGLRVAFVLTDPAAGFVLDARGSRARVEAEVRPEDRPRGRTHEVAAGSSCRADVAAPDVTLTLGTEAAERLLAGRLDVARALRSGELRSDVSTGSTLTIASVLTSLPRAASGRARSGPIGT